LLTALAAAVVAIVGVTVAAVALTSHGPTPASAASLIPGSVKTSVPKTTTDRGVTALKHSVPLRVRIPAIGVNAPVMQVGLLSNGTVQVPPLDNHNLAGWYKYGPTPGQTGASVILGHVDSVAGLSVFFNLKDLRKGDKVYVTLADGKTAEFEVDGLQRTPKTTFPTDAVYGKISYPGLRLITCGGAFDETTGHYVDNIIVYAHLV
jgi:LPXTG-site transpeptidase (sortase) family protein